MHTQVESISQYDELIKEGFVLVDFWAPWCGPCRMLAPQLEEAEEADELKDVKVLKVNVDDLHEIASRYGIQSIPTLILLKDGELKKANVGYIPSSDIIEFVVNNK